MAAKLKSKEIPTRASSRQKPAPRQAYNLSWVIAAAIFAALGFLIYSNSFNAGYHFDDELHILGNPTITDLSRWQAMLHYKVRFLTYFTFALNYAVGKLNPFGFHLVNTAIHVGSAWLAFALTMLSFRTPKMKSHLMAAKPFAPALLVGLIFVSHPLQTQAVTYIVQRAASLATFFYLGTVALYAWARIEEKPFLYFPAALTCVAAMFSKETAYTLPFAIVLYELVFFGIDRQTWKRLPAIALFFAVLVGVYFAAYAQASNVANVMESVSQDRGITRVQYLTTQFNVIRTYIRLLFLPYGQNLDHDYPLAKSFFEPATFLSFLFLVSLIVVAVKAYRKNALITFGILWFFLALSLESTIFPIVDVIFEHRLYLAMFGFALAFVAGLQNFMKSRRDTVILCLAAVLVFSVLTYSRNFVWANDYTLWSDVLKKSPRKPRAYINLASTYVDRKDFGRAAELYGKALAIDDRHAETYNAMGAMNHYKGDYDKAIEYYQKALQIDPDYIDVYYHIGLAYVRKREYDKAIEYYLKSIELRPKHVDVYNDLGIAYGLKEDYKAASRAFRQGLKINPNSVKLLRNLGVAFIKQRNVAGARKVISKLRLLGEMEKAAELEPDVAMIEEEDEPTQQVVTYFEKGKVVKRVLK